MHLYLELLEGMAIVLLMIVVDRQTATIRKLRGENRRMQSRARAQLANDLHRVGLND
jgi:hypothetical protein